MDEARQSDEGKQEAETADTKIAQPPASPPQQPPAGADAGGAADDPQPTEPILVRLVGGDDLEPFEEQTLALTRDSLDISRATFRIAIFGFLAALAAAVFVGVQVYEMTKQTQIFASQSEGANAGALMDEMNTRKQLAIAQTQANAAQIQAKAAQDSVKAIQRQIRLDHRASIVVKVSGPEPRTFNLGAPIVIPLDVSNIGKSTAKLIKSTVNTYILDITVDLGKTPNSWQGNFGSGVIFPGDKRFIPSELFNEGKIPVFLSDEINEKINSGKAVVLTFGRIDYRDLFGKRWTQFCFLTGPMPTKSLTTSEKKCNDYNKTDEER